MITKSKSVVAVSVPSGPPQDVRAEPQSSTELLVMWEPPARDKWNGNILGYYVGFRPATDSQVPSPAPGGFSFKTVEAGSGGRVVLPGLARFSSYHVVVQAYNSKGAGPASEPVMARTMEDGNNSCLSQIARRSVHKLHFIAPSMPPENVRCQKSTAQSIDVTWDPPPMEGRNGIVQGYKVTHQAVDEWFGEFSFLIHRREQWAHIC